MAAGHNNRELSVIKNMRLFKTTVLLAFFMALTTSFTASAKTKKMPKVYAFGFAASFNDSTVHFTPIQEIKDVEVDEKTKFVSNRNEYSQQLKDYFNQQGMTNRTCIIVASAEKKKVEKKYAKMRQKYQKDGGFDIRDITSDSFKFSSVVPATETR